MNNLNTHRDALLNLIKFVAPIADLKSALTKVPFDAKGDLVYLTSQDMKSVIQKYLAGEVTANTIEEWANLIEGRDGIGYEEKSQNNLKEIIHTFSNPLLTRPLDKQLALKLLATI